MTTYKIPLAVWEDFGGTFTAVSVDGDAAQATGQTANDAIQQIKKYLTWLARQESLIEPAMNQPRLRNIHTTVRAEYRTNDDSVYPAESRQEVSLPCVWEKCGDESYSCRLPTLDVDFHCYDEQSLQPMAVDFIQRELGGCEPRQLNRHLPPKRIWLDSVNVKVAERWQTGGQKFVQTLEQVADPMGSRSSRRHRSPAWARQAEVAQLCNRLQAKSGSLLLVGDRGVGKTTVLAEAVRMVERKLRDERSDKELYSGHRFWMTNGGRLIAGMQYLGQWEARCEAIVEELAEISGSLCIENLMELANTGGSVPTSSIAAFFAPYLERGELSLIGEVTPPELDVLQRILPGFDSLFEIVRLEEFNDSSAGEVLRLVSEAAKQKYGVSVSSVAGNLHYRLFRRFMPYESFPGKCTEWLYDLCRRARLKSKGRVEIGPAEIVANFSRLTGVPEWILRDDLTLNIDESLAWFEDRVIGQRRACQAANDLVASFKAGLNDPQRPIGVHLYCGPTGVGKTQLARSLAEYLFGAVGKIEQRLVRVDMSEYSTFGSAERLICRPDGKPSELIERVRAQPFAVVLFDEIEKAAPEVLDALLALFDEGRLTDRLGRTTSFRSAVVIMTSNLGVAAGKGIGFGGESSGSFERAVQKFFRPELFNRIDEVIAFDSLPHNVIRRITEKELRELAKREGIARRELRLLWSESLVDQIAAVGFDIRYGARPLQRTIEQTVVAPLARWLAENPKVRNRDVELRGTWKGGAWQGRLGKEEEENR